MNDSLLALLLKLEADPKLAVDALETVRGKVETVVAGMVTGNASIASAVESGIGRITSTGMLAFGAITALVGGMAELAKNTAEVGARMYEAHEVTGMSTESLSGLNAISRQTGENFDSLEKGLGRMTKNITEGIIDPSSKAGQVLVQLMHGAKNVADLGLKPMDERIQIVLKRIFELNDEGQRNYALQALLGRGWMTNVETLKLLAEQGYGRAIEAAKQFGLFFDAAAAKQAKEFMIEWEQGKLTLQAFGMVVGHQVIPALSGFLTQLITLGPRLEATAATLQVIITAFTNPAGLGASLASARAASDNFTRAQDHAANQVAILTAELKKQVNEALHPQAKAVKEVSDKLGEYIAKTREALVVLDAEGKPIQQLLHWYDLEVAAIDRATKADLDSAKKRHAAKAEIEAIEAKHQQALLDLMMLYNKKRADLATEENKKFADMNWKLQELLAKQELEWGKIRLSIDKTLTSQMKANLDEMLKDAEKYAKQLKKQHDEQIAEHKYEISMWQNLANTSLTAISQMTSGVQGYAGVFLRVAEQVVSAIINQIITEELAAASEVATDTTKTANKSKNVMVWAALKAKVNAAEAVEDFASGDYWGGTQHTLAAVMWGAIAAAPIALTAASAAQAVGARKSISSAGSTSSAAATPSGVVAMAPGAGGGGQVHVIVVGPTRGAAIVAGMLNSYVKDSGGMLYASHVARPAPAVRSGAG